MELSPWHPRTMMGTLAQASRLTPEQQGEILFWAGALVVMGAVIGVAGFLFYRRIKKGSETHDIEPMGFSLSEMRRLYEAGEVSHEEYTQVREKMLASAKKAMLSDAMTQPPTQPAAPAIAATSPTNAPAEPEVSTPEEPDAPSDSDAGDPPATDAADNPDEDQKPT